MTVNARMKIASTNMDTFCTGITVSNGKKLSKTIAMNKMFGEERFKKNKEK